MGKSYVQNRIAGVASVIVLAVYTILCFVLYYNQLLYPVTGLFESDTPVHVSMAVDDRFYYSITAFVYLLCSLTPVQNILIALFLTLLTSGAIPVTALVLDKACALCGITLTRIQSLISALSLNLVMGFYISQANRQHYIGYQNANMWHNSTYIAMRFMAVLSLYIILLIYEEKVLTLKRGIQLSLALAITTAVKPSFIVVIGPVLAIEAIYDLMLKKTTVKSFFGWVLIAVPSALVVFLQSIVLFGEDTGNGYAIAPFKALAERGDHPKITLILSVVFPLIVFLAHIKDFYKDRLYLGSLMIWAVGFLEVFLFTETGTRSGDGNFFWGYSIALFIAFSGALIKLFTDVKEGRPFKNFKGLNKIYYVVAGGVLLWHILSGVWYFSLLLTGVTYFV